MSRKDIFKQYHKPISRMNLYERKEYARDQKLYAADSIQMSYDEAHAYEQAILDAIEFFYPSEDSQS